MGKTRLRIKKMLTEIVAFFDSDIDNKVNCLNKVLGTTFTVALAQMKDREMLPELAAIMVVGVVLREILLAKKRALERKEKRNEIRNEILGISD